MKYTSVSRYGSEQKRTDKVILEKQAGWQWRGKMEKCCPYGFN